MKICFWLIRLSANHHVLRSNKSAFVGPDIMFLSFDKSEIPFIFLDTLFLLHDAVLISNSEKGQFTSFVSVLPLSVRTLK